MNRKLIGIIISIMTFLFSSLAFAGGPDIPPPKEGYFIMALGGNYWKASDSELAWASERDDFGNTVKVFILNPNFDFGANAKIGYLFPGGDTSVYLDYYYYNSNNLDTATASPGNTLRVHPDIDGIDFITSASFNADYEFHQLEAYTSHRVWSGHGFSANLFGGLQFAFNDRSMKTVAQGIVEDTDVGTGTSMIDNQFWAIGPSGGAKIAYNFPHHFSIYTQFEGGVLIGNINETITTVLRSNMTGVFTLTVPLKRRTQTIPMLGAEAGISWSCVIGSEGRSMDFILAYRISDYMHAFSGYSTLAAPSLDNSDIAYHGLVFRAGMTV